MIVSVADERDLELRETAIRRVLELADAYDGIVPWPALAQGFSWRGERVPFGSLYSGIHRPRALEGPAALTLITAPKDPYGDGWDPASDTFSYRFRDARSDTSAARLAAARDNRALRAAHELLVPVIYLKGIAPGQYVPVAPVRVEAVVEDQRRVVMRKELPDDVRFAVGLRSSEDTRRYATRQAAQRLHQTAFRARVLAAYDTRCTVCRLREAPLLQAAHIVEDREDRGSATVDNGLSLCAIHHLAYDRNLMGIDPRGVIHIQARLLAEVDGPMLANGLQHFHGARIEHPRRRADQPDPDRLDVRFQRFREAAA